VSEEPVFFPTCYGGFLPPVSLKRWGRIQALPCPESDAESTWVSSTGTNLIFQLSVLGMLSLGLAVRECAGTEQGRCCQAGKAGWLKQLWDEGCLSRLFGWLGEKVEAGPESERGFPRIATAYQSLREATPCKPQVCCFISDSLLWNVGINPGMTEVSDESCRVRRYLWWMPREEFPSWKVRWKPG